VLINGVPVNDMEWGGVYWSNWAGLADVTRSMQVQRGLGASKLAAPSVGGSINIVTRSTDAKRGGAISYGIGNDGYNKISFSASTGLTANKWAVTLLAAKTWGNGYIQGTEFEGYSYFANISKEINKNHTISLTGFGAPQTHWQRSNYDRLTISEWEKQPEGYKYNATYGFGLHGERKTSAYNYYHKPQISLNHYWNIDEKTFLSTALYTSIGRGGGYSGQGADGTYRGYWYGASTSGVPNTQFRAVDGTFDYAAIYALNGTSENGSLMYMSQNPNHHNWYGLLSTLTHSINDNIEFSGGLDLRMYKGTHTNIVSDLYGTDKYGYAYALDNGSRTASPDPILRNDDSWLYEKLRVGDVVYRDYDGLVNQYGIFGQAEYSKDKLTTFVSASLSNTSHARVDRYYYSEGNQKSETANYLGYTAKAGANYNINDNHNVFVNVGSISRAPYLSRGTFLNAVNSHDINPNAVNEKIFSVEFGYGFRSQYFTANVNAYHTNWNDKTITRGLTYTQNDTVSSNRGYLNVTGADALHQGIEFDFVFKPFSKLEITGMGSFGNWRWNNIAKGDLYNDAGQPINDKGQTVNDVANSSAWTQAYAIVDLKGVKTGNSAQTTMAFGVKYEVLPSFRLGLDYTFYANNYADFEIVNSSGSNISLSTNPSNERVNSYGTPWMIPAAGVFDFNMSYGFEIGGLRARLVGNVGNVFDQDYIVDATDGGSHKNEDVRVLYGFGRTMSLSLKINF
jgi:hypothetical protein